jgi:DNA-binding response OmpR family regulator
MIGVQDRRALVIDDDPLAREVLQTALALEGYAVLGAADGFQGWRAIREERPDVVLSDVRLPGIGGLELARRIRSDPIVGATPLILLSAAGTEGDRVAGLGAGADDYVPRPFVLRELVARVGAVVRRDQRLRRWEARPPGGPFSGGCRGELARHRFDTFVVGGGNRSAYEAARAAAERPGLRFNPLFLYGGPGLGKTHLMCALANEVYERDGRATARYLTSEEFSGQITDAYRNRQVDDLRRDLLKCDVLILDDVQFLSASESIQLVTAEILSELYDRGKQIVISSDRRPEKLPALIEEVSGTFAIGLVVGLDRPDNSLRQRILKAKVARAGWRVEDDLLDHVASRLDTDVRTLEGAVKRLVAMRELTGAELDEQTVDHILDGVSRVRPALGPAAESGRSGAGIEPATTRVSVGRSRPGRSPAHAAAPVPTDQREGTCREHSATPSETLSLPFSAHTRLRWLSGRPEEVAAETPHTGAQPLVILGVSETLVARAIEALAGASAHRRRRCGSDPWAHLVLAGGKSRGWMLVGTNTWNGNGLAAAVEANRPPVFLVLVDGGGSEISEAGTLISSVPAESKMAVVAVNVSSRARATLGGVLRGPLGIPDAVPVIVTGGIRSDNSRRWVEVALRGRDERAGWDPAPTAWTSLPGHQLGAYQNSRVSGAAH